MLAWTGGKRKLLEASHNFHGRSFANQNAQQRMHGSEGTKLYGLLQSQDAAVGVEAMGQHHSLQKMQRQHPQAAAQGSIKRRRTAQGQSIDMLICNGLDGTSKDSASKTLEPCRRAPAMPKAPAAAAAGCNTSKKSTTGTANQDMTTCSEQLQSSFTTPPRLSAAAAARLAPHTTTAATDAHSSPPSSPKAAAPHVPKLIKQADATVGLPTQHRTINHTDWRDLLCSSSCKQQIGEVPLAQVPRTIVPAAGAARLDIASELQLRIQQSLPDNLLPTKQQFAALSSLQDSSKQARQQFESYDMLLLSGTLLV